MGQFLPKFLIVCILKEQDIDSKRRHPSSEILPQDIFNYGTGQNQNNVFCFAAGTDLTAFPQQSWSNLNRRKFTVIVNTDLTPGDDRKKIRY